MEDNEIPQHWITISHWDNSNANSITSCVNRHKDIKQQTDENKRNQKKQTSSTNR